MSIFLFMAVVTIGLYYVVKLLGPEMAKPPIEAKVERADIGTEKLETLLSEKNKHITLLQRELKVFHAQVLYFNKVIVPLEEEIHRLRDQNRIFRSELGLPTSQAKQNSIN